MPQVRCRSGRVLGRVFDEHFVIDGANEPCLVISVWWRTFEVYEQCTDQGTGYE